MKTQNCNNSTDATVSTLAIIDPAPEAEAERTTADVHSSDIPGQQPESIVSYDDKQKHAASLTDVQLCEFLERALAPAKKAVGYNLPYLAEARGRFAKQGRRVPVPGQPSWSEWVETYLCITDRHVRRLLAEYRQKQLEQTDPGKAEQKRLEAEQKKAQAAQKREESKQRREAAQRLTVALAAKAVELAELVSNGETEAAQKLASAIRDASNVADAALLPTAQMPCSGCEQLHSGIATVLTTEPHKPLDSVAIDCGVSITVVRQAATRFGILPVLTAKVHEVSYVA